MANEIVEATLAQMTSMGKKLRVLIRELSSEVKTLQETGGQANVLERVKVNGRLLTPDSNKTVDVTVPTRVGQLENDASYQENKIETIQVNGTTQSIIGKTVNVHVPTAVGELTNDAGYQTNVLEGVKVNGLALEIDKSKNVDISIPTKVSELTNDKVYQTKTEVENAVKTAVAESKHLTFQKVSSVPAVEDASEDVMYLVMNPVTKHYDIYAKLVDESGNVIMDQLDDTTVDLSGYVEKEAGKGLSHNDFTDALLAKLNGIAEKANLYVHPSHTAYAEGLYKMTVNVLGHVTKATSVTKGDITALGIPGQDTHDWAGITDKPATFTPSAHNHDERYYTETETDKLLGGKSDTGHVHDDRYYTETEMDAKLSKKSDTGHTHDDRYYTESEMNTKLAEKLNLSGGTMTGPLHIAGTASSKPLQVRGIVGCDSDGVTDGELHLQYGANAPIKLGNDAAYSISADGGTYTGKANTAGTADSAKSVAWGSVTGKPTTYPPSSHTHGQYYDSGVSRSANTVLAAPDGKTGGATFRKLGLADIPNASDLINALTSGDASPVDNDLIVTQWANHEAADASNQNTYVRRPMSSIWGYIKSKADSVYQSKGNYAASSHTHTKSQITDFPTLGTAAAKNVGDFAAASHNHDTSYYKKSEIDAKLRGVAVSGHTHKKADITDFPTSMPASDVKAWAKAANKPSYTKAEVGLGSVDNTADSAKDVSSAGRIRNDSRQTALSGTASPTTGLTVYQVYNNGYPVPYGNVISVMGNGAGQILAAWSGTSGAVARLYYRNKRDSSDANWSAWKTLAFTDDKPATAGTADTAKSVAWDNVTGKPSTFTPATHSHAWGDVTGKPSTFAPSAHKHVKADITDFPKSLPASDVSAWAKASSKPSYTWNEITGKPGSFTPASHTHTKSQITDFPTIGAAAAKAVRTLSTAGASGWKDQTTDDGYVPTMSFMAYWNGAYSGSSSNLAYCNKGAFGTAATKNTGDFAAASHSHTTVNGHSVNADVPSGAKFTDTNTWRGIQNNLTSDATDQSLSAAQGKVLKGLVDGKAASSHTHDDRYYTESEIDTKLSGKANSSHTHNYAGSSSAGGTAASVNGFTFGVQTSDPGANSSLTTNKFLFVYE